MLRSNQSGIVLEDLLGVPAGLEQELEVLTQAPEAQPRHAGLARAAELARPAKREIVLGDLEAIGGRGHRVEPYAGRPPRPRP